MAEHKVSKSFPEPDSNPGLASLMTVQAYKVRQIEAISGRLLTVPEPTQSKSGRGHGDDEPLVVQFLRNGNIVEEHTAEDGHDAVRIIIVMTSRLDELQAHDVIRISRV
jgi:hypothetical protein